jgi:hypothetical protein
MRLSGRSLLCGGSPNTELGCAGDCLLDDAAALGQTQQPAEVALAGVGVEVEPDADRPESRRHLFVDRERSAKVEFALGGHRAAADFDAQRVPNGAGLAVAGSCAWPMSSHTI